MAELRHNSLSPYKTRWHTARASRQRTYERTANSNAQARGRQTDALTSGGGSRGADGAPNRRIEI